MAVLFRPDLPVDHEKFVPVFQKVLAPFDFRVYPDTGNGADIKYYITWKLYDGDAEAYPNLSAVLAMGAGVNHFIGHPDFPKNAKLLRMLDPGLDQSMVEYVLSYVMRLHRNHDDMPALLDAHPWANTIPPLAGQTRVGFLGYGNLASQCARPLKSLGFQLRAWKRSPFSEEGIEIFTGWESLDDFLGGCDILVCLLPLTPDTRDILNKESLSRLPAGACLINAGRGKHLVEDDLIPLLDSGHIKRAVLDVFRTEPVPRDHPFRSHPRIIMTPHIAAMTIPESGAQVLRENIEELERGGEPAGTVDTAKGY